MVVGVYTLAIALSGGFEFRLAGVRIRSHSWIRPAIIAATFGVAAAALARHRLVAAATSAWTALDAPSASRWIAVVAAAWSLAAGIQFGTFAAGGADSYGYVSQAVLLSHGTLTDEVDLRPEFQWPSVRKTLTPLGYVSGTLTTSISPVYPPGFPLLMAPVATFSTHAVYFVVPLLGVLAVWCCYKLGVACGDPLAGAIGAVLFALSPAFLVQLVQPMSDVPAAACWLAALVAASRGSRWSALAAGAAACMAILVRPNLAPLILIVAALAAASAPAGRRFRGAAAVMVWSLPGFALLGGIQTARYGSPFASGYGDLGRLFDWSSVVPNLQRYPRWLTETHTWFVWLWILVPLVAWRTREARAPITASLCVIVMLFAIYLPYSYFQPTEWHYLRFLLPAIGLMLMLGAMVALTQLRKLPGAAAFAITVAMVIALGLTFARTAVTRDVFRLHALESKYPTAGTFVDRSLPANAIILAGQHSGSVRFYGRRPILRWDLLEPGALDGALADVRRAGLQPFMVVEPFEYDEFRGKFANQEAVGRTRLLAIPRDVRVYALD